ncbi:glycosyltransferase [Zavarzinia compransoris]|uniref:Glycosyl transferase family 1 n=1 Tax=Zavarzinia compransoris TaxID=1264899 RepID=A0A317DUA4_9PROT|nr:glycosyltransferase [Zavarzinia compransoris]PWR18221.1 hypothetical protein DKG75_19825 [Zavarzinia compransoris]TDP40886.1 glycosyltransferase involved in cell wall biosynthesis [Zavarzinia compransoris]
MRALVISPIATDPSSQGNSVRVGRLCELLEYAGYTIHFLYYGLEGVNDDQRRAMSRRWRHVHFVDVETRIKATAPDGYALDDFCGPELLRAVETLQLQWRFSLAIVNYVWMSAACEVIDPETLTIIDTHDLFGDRHYTLQEQGVAPTWYYTTPAEEARGLDRARLVLAIQDEEADVLRQRTKREVATLGHILPENFLQPRRREDGVLRIGYIASGNPSNRLSLTRLIEAASRREVAALGLRFVVAGEICRHLPPDIAAFEAVGYVDDAVAFYRDIDVVVNPNISGTGLKIKNVEALSFGMPLVSTGSGMCGIFSDTPAHLCKTVDDAVEMLAGLSRPGALDALRLASRSVYTKYMRTQIAAFDVILAKARAHGGAGGRPE